MEQDNPDMPDYLSVSGRWRIYQSSIHMGWALQDRGAEYLSPRYICTFVGNTLEEAQQEAERIEKEVP